MGDAAMAVICGLDFWILGSPHTPDPGGVQPAERYTAPPLPQIEIGVGVVVGVGGERKARNRRQKIQKTKKTAESDIGWMLDTC